MPTQFVDSQQPTYVLVVAQYIPARQVTDKSVAELITHSTPE